MDEVRKAANEIASPTDRIDLLINNAGAIIGEHQVTSEGFEARFAGNHLGSFLLTQSFMPLLRIAVNTASGAHQMIRDMEWDDLQLEKDYRPSVGPEIRPEATSRNAGLPR
jgi:NAD(P)-dependent dehydrogenase (short-subunit alcohol dehydrogenase family)